MESEVGKLLAERNLSISCAESCTGGLLTSRLTDVAGSSRYVKGSIVSYTNEVKERVLGVDHQLLVECPDAVSADVASQMAEGVRRFIGADIGVGVTGLAGPSGGTDEKPVGLVYVAVSGSKGTVTTRNVFSGNRADIKLAASEKALAMLKEYLLREV